jgi:hypothetical protein
MDLLSSIGSGLGTIAPTAVGAAALTLAGNFWIDRRKQKRVASATALVVARHLELYAYSCAGQAFTIAHAGAPDRHMARIPLLPPWPSDVVWGELAGDLASDAMTMEMSVVIAIGIVLGDKRTEVRLQQTRRLCCELGLTSWLIANQLRSVSGLPHIDRAKLRWDFVRYLWGDYGKSVASLRHLGTWWEHEWLDFPGARLFPGED